jgi:putative phosphoesterase
MKIALFSDIHANLPALEAVLADIDEQKPDFIYCLGDLVGYNIWPNEVAALIRDRRIPVIAGNYDEGIGLNSDDCGCAYKTDEEKANGAVSISFTNETVNEKIRAYLRNLPRHMSLKFENNQESIHLLMVHGSPRRINEYLFEDRPEKSLMRILEGAQTDIMLFGHTHVPFHRVLSYEHDGQTAFRHAINTGSVGKPKDGDPRACYVMITINENLSNFQKESVIVEFRRVDYDVEKAAGAVENSSLPDKYAESLRVGR